MFQVLFRDTWPGYQVNVQLFFLLTVQTTVQSITNEELDENWMLTFEQFVAAIQQEPELCQFFAEQNRMDLEGTSVDPILNPYTKTVLAVS